MTRRREGDAQEQQRMRLPLLVGGPAAAALATGLLVLWDATGTTQSELFIETPEFLLWWLALIAQAAAWSILGPLLWITVRRRTRALYAAGHLDARTLAGLAVALGLTVMLGLGPSSYLQGNYLWLIQFDTPGIPDPNEFPLVHHPLKLGLIVGVGAILALLAMAGMLGTAVGFSALQPSRPPERDDLQAFMSLRDELTLLLTVAAVLVGLAAVATGLLRVALLAVADDPIFAGQLTYEPEYVVAYGVFFSALLGLVFAVSFTALRAAGGRLRDRAHPLPAPADPDFGDVLARRAVLDDVLQTKLSAISTFKAGGAILTPLLGSLASFLLSS